MNLSFSLGTISSWLPFTLTFFIGLIFLFFSKKFIEYRTKKILDRSKIYWQLSLLFLVNLFIVILVINTPLSEGLKGQLLSLLGITFTAAIALSSTTFMGNIMAGLMIKALSKFRPGDYLRVGENFGRVSEMGLLHTEIQSSDKDLITLPNLFLVTQPVKVISSEGTLISEDLSLGYEIHHNTIERSLLKAANQAELKDPFMHVQKLGDYSVTYRISGFFSDVRRLLSAKAKLREQILDCLHADGIEIVSPSFMNQRVFPDRAQFIAAYEYDSVTQPAHPEKQIFDKAEEAESVERLKEILNKIEDDIVQLGENIELSEEERNQKYEVLIKRKEKLIELIQEKSKE